MYIIQQRFEYVQNKENKKKNLVCFDYFKGLYITTCSKDPVNKSRQTVGASTPQRL